MPKSIFFKAGFYPALFFTTLAFTFSFTARDAFAQSDPIPVTIYATQSQYGVPVNETGSSVTVFTEQDIKAMGAVTAADALRYVPGVSVNQSGGIGSLTQVRIRGGEANHILLIIDGVRYNDPAGLGFDFSGLLAGDIERIEVIRGPQSGIYGSDAHSGVIAITTKSAKGLNGVTSSVSAEAGSFRTLTTSVFSGAGNGTAWASISADGVSTQGYNVSTAGSEADGADIGTLNLKAGARPIDGLTLDSLFRFGRRRAEFDDENFFDPAAPPFIDSALPHYIQNDISGRATATYQAPGSNLQQVVSWDTYAFTRNSIDAFGPFDSQGRRQEALYRATYSFDTPAFANATHVVSFQASNERDDYMTNFQPFHIIETNGFAGEWRTTLFENLFLTAAVRHDQSSFFMSPTTYHLSSRYNFNNGFFVHAAVGTGVTNPTLDELFGSGSGFVGNPALKPEQDFQWETGAGKSWFNGQFTTDVTYFNGRATNEIRTLFFPIFTAVNDPGSSPRQGIETTLTYTPFPWFSLSGTYTYLSARTSADVEEIRRPPNSGSLNMLWRFLDGKGSLSLAVAFNGTMLDQDFRSFPAPLVPLPGYALVNGVLSYQINDNTEAYLRLQNALDQQYQEVFGLRGQPFSAFAGVKVHLNK